MEQVVERRGVRRRHPLFYLALRDTKSEKLLGYVYDITPEGCMVMSSRPITVDDRDYYARMLLPSSIAVEKSGIRFVARCMWCKRDINPDLYASGLQITDIDADGVRAIHSIMRQYSFKE